MGFIYIIATLFVFVLVFGAAEYVSNTEEREKENLLIKKRQRLSRDFQQAWKLSFKDVHDSYHNDYVSHSRHERYTSKIPRTNQPDKLRLEIGEAFAGLKPFEGWAEKTKRKNRLKDILS
jgi:hypothetical protein